MYLQLFYYGEHRGLVSRSWNPTSVPVTAGGAVIHGGCAPLSATNGDKSRGRALAKSYATAHVWPEPRASVERCSGAGCGCAVGEHTPRGTAARGGGEGRARGGGARRRLRGREPRRGRSRSITSANPRFADHLSARESERRCVSMCGEPARAADELGRQGAHVADFGGPRERPERASTRPPCAKCSC